jgi:hypothetical protein
MHIQELTSFLGTQVLQAVNLPKRSQSFRISIKCSTSSETCPQSQHQVANPQRSQRDSASTHTVLPFHTALKSAAKIPSWQDTTRPPPFPRSTKTISLPFPTLHQPPPLPGIRILVGGFSATLAIKNDVHSAMSKFLKV